MIAKMSDTRLEQVRSVAVGWSNAGGNSDGIRCAVYRVRGGDNF